MATGVRRTLVPLSCRWVIIVLITAMVSHLSIIPAAAQGITPGSQEALISMSDMLRYQRGKNVGKTPPAPFKKYDMRHIRASKVLNEGDSRTLWGYRVGANLEYDKEKQPLYRLFKKKDFGSVAVIDYPQESGNKCELIFWGKKYYRRFAHDLRRMGFDLRNSKSQTNVLEFRRKDTDVGVDVTIWPDIYIMTFLVVGSE